MSKVTKSKTKDERFVDDATELKEMAIFYSKDYSEVYFIRDLQADCIVAVECYPHKPGTPPVTRNGRKLDCLNYKNRLMASRERLDKLASGKPMVGYESISGNDTRLAKVESGIVNKTAITDLASVSTINPSSPFEKAQLATAVQLSQASSKDQPDYEEYINATGNLVERYETFERERIK